MKIFSPKFAILLFIAAVIPLTLVLYNSDYERLSESVYVTRHWPLLRDFLNHDRWILEAARNWREGRLSTLAVVDEHQPLNSFPQFQYYGVGLYYLVAPLQILTGDVILTSWIVIGLFSFVFAYGVFLWCQWLTGCQRTALVVALVSALVPYRLTELFFWNMVASFAANSLLPLLSFLWVHFILKETPIDPVERFKDSLHLAALVTLGSTFLLTHNLTSMYAPLLLGPPLWIFLHRRLGGKPFPLARACLPLVLVLACSLFYWWPILRDHGSLLIRHDFYVMIPQALRMAPWHHILSPFPRWAFPFRGMNIQLGVPLILLGILFFRRKTAFLYLFIAEILFLACTNVWRFFPEFLQAIQFPYRLLSFATLLVLLASRRLKRSEALVLTAITVVFTPLLFDYHRAPRSRVDFSQFPVSGHADFLLDQKESLPPLQMRRDLPSNNPIQIPSLAVSSLSVLTEAAMLSGSRHAASFRVKLSGYEGATRVRAGIAIMYPGGEKRIVSPGNSASGKGNSGLGLRVGCGCGRVFRAA